MRNLFALLAPLLLAACASTPIEHEATLSAEAVRADLRALYQGLQSGHYDLYAHTSKPDYDRLYTDTRASIRAPMTPLAAHALLQRFTAAGHVAHATLGFPSSAYEAFRAAGGRTFPLAVRIESEGVFVAQNLSGAANIASGAEILSIDGVPTAQWLTRLRRNISADNDHLAMAQIEPAFSQLLWLERGEVAAFEVALRAPDGAETMLRLASRTRAEMIAASEAAPPHPFVDYTQRLARILPDGVAYLRPGIFLNVDSEDMFDTTSFHAFIDTSFERFIVARADTLLIDLRDNPGGDNSFSDYMISWFATEPFRFASQFRIRVSPEAIASNTARLQNAGADSVSRQLDEAYSAASIGDRIDFALPLVEPRHSGRFEGRVFVLVNRRSFSNSVFVAAIIQDYGFGRVMGEPTSDLATTYGAAEQFALSNTGLSVSFPKAFIVRPSGDMRVQGVTPEIAIETPPMISGEDAVLAEALRLIDSLAP